MSQKHGLSIAAGEHSLRQIVNVLDSQGFTPEYNFDLGYCGDFTVKGAVVDSREAKKDWFFVARPGARQDGHKYIDKAYENGCRHFLVHQSYCISSFLAARAVFIAIEGSTEAALFAWAKDYRRRLSQLYVLAISGSYGKTSTKELLGHILAQRYRCAITMGNRNAPVGCALTILGIAPETEIAVLELGIDQPGEMDLLCSLAQPNGALLTGIGSAHLAGFGSQEHLACQKARIYAHLHSLEPGYSGPFYQAEKLALLPEDDDFIDLLRTEITGQEIPYSGTLMQQQGYAVEDRGLKGLRFTVWRENHFAKQLTCDLPLLGLHTQKVFWAAASVAQILGLSVAEIFSGAQNYQPLFGRGELLQMKLKQEGYGGTVGVLQDCYNASPESLYALIEMLRSWDKQNLLPPCVLVLADMLELGSASIEYHYKVGALLSNWFAELPAVKVRLSVLLYGSQMKFAWEKLASLYKDSCRYLKDEVELEQAILNSIVHFLTDSSWYINFVDKQPLLVLKGARNMYLEKVIQKILL